MLMSAVRQAPYATSTLPARISWAHIFVLANLVLLEMEKLVPVRIKGLRRGGDDRSGVDDRSF